MSTPIRIAAGATVATPTSTGRSPAARLRPVDLRTVRLTDTFWATRRRIGSTAMLASQYRRCEDVGAIDNFRRAAGRLDGDHEGMFYADSDVYKWLEAASWVLAEEPEHELRGTVDNLIDLIEAAQSPDGYLNTYFTGARSSDRWTNLRYRHEIYCGGHLVQAAIAHYRATGERQLLDVAIRFADHLDERFGPAGTLAACGHPEAEMALVELYRVTAESRYLTLARRMVDARGQQPTTIVGVEPTYGGDAWAIQDHRPVAEQHEVVGHAVRALYLLGGVADLLLEGAADDLAGMLEAAWGDVRDRKSYVTGGVGARWHYESIGGAYELDNERAYAETCAAIAHAQFAWRLLLATGHGQYRDALERALFNGMAAGFDLSGERYFYQNPLADRGSHRRSPWFETACCPPNIARTLASLPAYMWTTDDEGGVWNHLYADGTATIETSGGAVGVVTRTDYPWAGRIVLTVDPGAPRQFTVHLPIPGWCESWTLTIAGQPVDARAVDGYVHVNRVWVAGDEVTVDLSMPVRPVVAHPRVLAAQGRIALQRGPLVYCLEQADHDTDVWDIAVDPDQSWQIISEPESLGGVITLRGLGTATVAPGDGEPLYRPYRKKQEEFASRPVELRAVPYAVWANRAPGPMIVWMRVS